jgi:hypothetical protein
MFCAPGLIFGVTEGVGSRFPRPESFWTLPRAPGLVSMFCAPGLVFGGTEAVGPVFMFCAPGLVFGVTDGVRSRFNVLHARNCFHVLHTQTRFRRCQVRRVPFLYFALPDSFSAVPTASGPIFMFCAPGFILGGTKGILSHFHVLPSQTCF